MNSNFDISTDLFLEPDITECVSLSIKKSSLYLHGIFLVREKKKYKERLKYMFDLINRMKGAVR
jgi:hypothetical protein